MKKSVKKVLAALLSVLLFASLFTTTAFAAKAPGQEDVEAAQKTLNSALDKFYGNVGQWYVNMEKMNKEIYNAAVDKAADAIATNLVKNYPGIAAMIAAGVDPATAWEKWSVGFNNYWKGYATFVTNEYYAAGLEAVAAHVDAAADAYLANLAKFEANLEAFYANLSK